jgi:hypothetical protein
VALTLFHMRNVCCINTLCDHISLVWCSSQYYHTNIALLPYSHTTTPSYHTPILPYSHTTIIPYSYTPKLPYSHTPKLPYSHTPILPYHHTPIRRRRRHPEVQAALRKIEEVTLVPHENYESFQVPNVLNFCRVSYVNPAYVPVSSFIFQSYSIFLYRWICISVFEYTYVSMYICVCVCVCA